MRRAFILLSLLISVSLMAQKRTAFEIRGHIDNPTHGEKIYFLHFGASERYVDSISITDGSFSFKGKTKISYEPEENYTESQARLFLDHSGTGIDFEKMNSHVYYDFVTVYLEAGTTDVHIIDSARKGVVTPPRANAGHYTLDSIYTAYFKKSMECFAQAKKLQLKGAEFISYQDNGRQIFTDEQERDLWQFIKWHPGSPVSLYILKHNKDYYPDYDKIAPYFNLLNDTLKNTDFGKQYAKMLDRLQLTRLGAQAPEFTMNEVDGKGRSLSSFKGKYVLIDFWASWCGPCRRENPNVLKAYSQYKNKNFTVLGISLDQKKDNWVKAINDDQLNWTQLSDLAFWQNAAAQLYSVKAIPQNFLVDPDGKIIGKNLFGKGLTERLATIFGQ
jgi:peroxiredoxin